MLDLIVVAFINDLQNEENEVLLLFGETLEDSLDSSQKFVPLADQVNLIEVKQLVRVRLEGVNLEVAKIEVVTHFSSQNLRKDDGVYGANEMNFRIFGKN